MIEQIIAIYLREINFVVFGVPYSTDNRAATVLQYFLSTYGVPHKIRTDGGGESIDVWRHMIQQWGSSRVIVGSSVHIERLEGCESLLLNHVTLIAMEEEGILDPDNEVDIYCLHQALTGQINDRLAEFIRSWNNHLLRSEANFTPQDRDL